MSSKACDGSPANCNIIRKLWRNLGLTVLANDLHSVLRSRWRQLPSGARACVVARDGKSCCRCRCNWSNKAADAMHDQTRSHVPMAFVSRPIAIKVQRQCMLRAMDWVTTKSRDTQLHTSHVTQQHSHAWEVTCHTSSRCCLVRGGIHQHCHILLRIFEHDHRISTVVNSCRRCAASVA